MTIIEFWNVSALLASISILCWFWMNIVFRRSSVVIGVTEGVALDCGERRGGFGGTPTWSMKFCHIGSSPMPLDFPLTISSLQSLRCFTPYRFRVPFFSRSLTKEQWTSFHKSLPVFNFDGCCTDSASLEKSSVLFLFEELAVAVEVTEIKEWQTSNSYKKDSSLSYNFYNIVIVLHICK